MSYFKQIHTEKMAVIKEEQMTLFDPTLTGEEVSDEKFFDSIFRNNFSVVRDFRNTTTTFKNFVHLVNIQEGKNGEIAKAFVCDSLKKVLENKDKFKYFGVNQFNTPKSRTKDDLSSLNAIVLDFDLMKDGTKRDYSSDMLAYVVFNELDKYPHFVWATKTDGNYQSMFLINQVGGQGKYVLLFEAIAKRLSISLGSDYSATVANKLFSVPRKGIKQYESTDVIYDLDDFKHLFEDEFINDRLSELQAQFENNKIVNFTEQQLLNSKAIQALMNCEIDSQRNHACFTLSLFFYSIGWEKSKTEKFFNDDWYYKANNKDKFPKRFTKAEIKSCIKSAYSSKYAGASREWIEGLTGETFNYSVYKSTYISKNAYMKASEIRVKVINWIRENPDTIINQKNLSEILNVGLRSLERNLKAMEDEGVLMIKKVYEGRKRLGSQLELLEQQKFTVEKNDNFDFNKLDELDNIVELNKVKKSS